MFTDETDLNLVGFNVCDYSGQMAVYNADGTYTNVMDQGTHNGCVWGNGFITHHPLEHQWQRHKRFLAKWKSANTGQAWVNIGYLVD
jgi:hypothetical protein